MTALRSGGRSTSITLAIIDTVQLMVVLDATVVNVALPDVQRDLDFSSTGLSWVLNAYTLTFGGLMLLGGRMGDVLGRRRVFTAGVAVFTLASLLGGLATSSGLLLGARALQGVGAAIAAPSMLALIMTNFAEGTPRNKALGVFTAVSAAGGSVGLILGGMLTTWASWRWALFINVPIGVAVVLATPRFIADTPRVPGRFDAVGAVSSTFGIAALVYGFIRVAEDGWSETVALVAFGLAVVVLAGFFALEGRVRQPLLPLRLLAGRNASAGYVSMLLLPAAMFGMFFFLTQFIQEVLGASALTTGLAFLPLTVVLFAVSQVVPALLPKYGPKPFLVAGLAAITVALAWLTQLSESTSYLGGLAGPMLLFGLGGGLAFMPLSAIILGGVRDEDSGAASGLLQTMQQIGGTLGVAILVTVFGTASGSAAAQAGVAPPDDVLADGMATAFQAGTVFALVALALVALAIKTPKGGAAIAPGAEPVHVG